MKQAQVDYDDNAAVKDIQEQLSGSAEFAKPVSQALSTIKYAFTERSRIAKAFFYNKVVFAAKDWFTERLEIVNSLLSLCARQGRLAPRISRKRKLAPESSDGQDKAPPTSNKRKLALEFLEENALPESTFCEPNICKPEPAEVDHFPVKCKPFQCLFCIGWPGLPLDQRFCEYYNKFSLQRHVQCCPFKLIRSNGEIACPHPTCVEVILGNMMYFKSHAAKVHVVNM